MHLLKQRGLTPLILPLILSPSEQRHLFDRDWEDRIISPGGLAILTLFLENDMFEKVTEKTDGELLAKVANIPELLHGADGNIVVKIHKETETAEYSELDKFNAMSHLLYSPYFRELIEMVEEQSNEIKKITSEFHSLKQDVVASIAGEFGVPLKPTITPENSPSVETTMFIYDWPNDMSEIMRVQEKRLEVPASEFRNKLEAVLLPMQRNRLKEIRASIIMRCFGPWADIKSGALGKTMALTATQLKTLETRRQKVIHFVEKETQKAANEFIDGRLAELPDGLKSRLQTVMGEPEQGRSIDLYMIATSSLR